MRRLILSLLIVLLVAPAAYAATDNILEGMGQKAVRGAVNLVTGVVEIPMQVYKGYENGFEPIKQEGFSKTVGTILGFFRGISHAAGRTTWGALELCGFWTANPQDNRDVGVPFDAEYAWETGEQYSIFEPNFEEGIKPIGNKLGHGFANALLGIAEVPGQIRQVPPKGNIMKGLGEGIWFWLSREVYGLGSIFTCIVPNPKDNPGYAFDGEWPWSALSEETK